MRATTCKPARSNIETQSAARCHSPPRLHLRWPEDAAHDEQETFMWSVLKPADWRKERHLGWCYAASELPKLRAQPHKRKA
eukprot:2389453-Prymnesium_polylepis.1